MLEMVHKFIAQNQYGDTVFIKRFPRKELLEHTGYASAQKMYLDTTSGKSVHIGYVIGGMWWDVMKVAAWH